MSGSPAAVRRPAINTTSLRDRTIGHELEHLVRKRKRGALGMVAEDGTPGGEIGGLDLAHESREQSSAETVSDLVELAERKRTGATDRTADRNDR